MANAPLITCTVKVTARDINNNNIAKTFSMVKGMVFDYNDATVNIIDVTGSFYFSLTPMTAFTYTIVPNPNGSHAVVMS